PPLASFVVLCRPPTPPLFPYTTLFRSPDLRKCGCDVAGCPGGRRRCLLPRPARGRRGAGAVGVGRPGGAGRRRTGVAGRAAGARSEEHTSELQSRFDLVCRLLLEKKNT